MKCDEAAKLVHAYLDKELSSKDVTELEKHVKECVDCFGSLEFDQSLRKALKHKTLETKLSEEIKALIRGKIKE